MQYVKQSQPGSDADEIQIPIRCPACGHFELAAFPVPVVVIALTSWRQMRLYASCCPGEWDASQSDLDAIQKFVGERWLEVQREVFVEQRQSMRRACRVDE